MEYADFLALRNCGNGILTVHAPDNESFIFSGLDLDFISGICPLLTFSFEGGTNGRRLHSLNASSIELISRFLRFLYTGSYLILDHAGIEQPCSLLIHAQLYHYGELYDVSLLMDTAYLHISQICEIACSMPTPPLELCKTLRYLYNYVTGSHDIHDTFLHYCMNCFVYHRLGQDEDFKKLLADVKAFEQGLFKVNMERGFQDEGSSEIIQMQLPAAPRKQEQNFDYLYDMFGSNNSTPMQTPLLSPTPGYTLVHRPRQPISLPATDDSDGYSSEGSQSSDLENFSLVGRPRPNTQWFGELPAPTRTPGLGADPSTGYHGSTNSASSFGESKRLDRPPVGHAKPQTSLGPDSEHHNASEDFARFSDIPSSVTHPFVTLGGVGQTTTPPNGTNEPDDPFDDFFDADESDSEWSIISGDGSPRAGAGKTELPIRSRSLYTRQDLTGSTETVIAVSDNEPHVSDQTSRSMDGESSDSEWSMCSDEPMKRTPT